MFYSVLFCRYWIANRADQRQSRESCQNQSCYLLSSLSWFKISISVCLAFNRKLHPIIDNPYFSSSSLNFLQLSIFPHSIIHSVFLLFLLPLPPFLPSYPFLLSFPHRFLRSPSHPRYLPATTLHPPFILLFIFPLFLWLSFLHFLSHFIYHLLFPIHLLPAFSTLSLFSSSPAAIYIQTGVNIHPSCLFPYRRGKIGPLFSSPWCLMNVWWCSGTGLLPLFLFVCLFVFNPSFICYPLPLQVVVLVSLSFTISPHFVCLIQFSFSFVSVYDLWLLLLFDL